VSLLKDRGVCSIDKSHAKHDSLSLEILADLVLWRNKFLAVWHRQQQRFLAPERENP
jgi:hypothetical protein